MTDFPTLSYTPPSEIPTLSYREYPPVSKMEKSYVDAKEKPIYLYDNVYES